MLTFSAASERHVDGKPEISEEIPSEDRKKHDGKNLKVTRLHRILKFTGLLSDSSSRSHKKKKNKDRDRAKSKVSSFMCKVQKKFA